MIKITWLVQIEKFNFDVTVRYNNLREQNIPFTSIHHRMQTNVQSQAIHFYRRIFESQ